MQRIIVITTRARGGSLEVGANTPRLLLVNGVPFPTRFQYGFERFYHPFIRRLLGRPELDALQHGVGLRRRLDDLMQQLPDFVALVLAVPAAVANAEGLEGRADGMRR